MMHSVERTNGLMAKGAVRKNDEFCVQKRGILCSKPRNSAFKMMHFCRSPGRIRISGRYCELQYKCHNKNEFSIENAEIMANCPWKMMIFYWKMAIYFAIRGTRCV